MLIALAALAAAGIRHDAEAPASQRQSDAAAGQLAAPPAAEPDAPAILTAAASTSGTIQTVLVVASRRQLRPTLNGFAATRHLTVVAHSPGTPRFFPLLI